MKGNQSGGTCNQLEVRMIIRGLGHFHPEIDDKSCLNRSWTDERSLY